MPTPGYELRRGDELVATGHLTRGESAREGARITIGGLQGIVRAAEAVLRERERRPAVQLLASVTSHSTLALAQRHRQNRSHELGDQPLCALEALRFPTLSSFSQNATG